MRRRRRPASNCRRRQRRQRRSAHSARPLWWLRLLAVPSGPSAHPCASHRGPPRWASQTATPTQTECSCGATADGIVSSKRRNKREEAADWTVGIATLERNPRESAKPNPTRTAPQRADSRQQTAGHLTHTAEWSLRCIALHSIRPSVLRLVLPLLPLLPLIAPPSSLSSLRIRPPVAGRTAPLISTRRALRACEKPSEAFS